MMSRADMISTSEKLKLCQVPQLHHANCVVFVIPCRLVPSGGSLVIAYWFPPKQIPIPRAPSKSGLVAHKKPISSSISLMLNRFFSKFFKKI